MSVVVTGVKTVATKAGLIEIALIPLAVHDSPGKCPVLISSFRGQPLYIGIGTMGAKGPKPHNICNLA